ncbi:MAG: DUF6491 family protein [Pseudomonadota bacterium]
MRLAALLAVAAVFAAGCTTTAQSQTASAATSRDCFRNQDINGWSLIDPHTLRVEITPRRAYALTVQPDARDLNFTESIAIQARGSDDWICTNDVNDIRISAHDTIPRTWWVTKVERLPQPAVMQQPQAAPHGS